MGPTSDEPGGDDTSHNDRRDPERSSLHATVLLVDDNADDAELTLRALARSGVSDIVDVARDGEEALEYLLCEGRHLHRRDEPLPKLVLLDLNLPGIGGLEVLRRLRQQPRTRRLPVVVLTSSREDSDLARSYDLGANSYVRKSVDFKRFVETAHDLARFWLLHNELARSEST